MRRFIVLLSVLILAFLVAACGNSSQARTSWQTEQSGTASTDNSEL